MLFTSTIFQHLGHKFSVLFSSVETVALTKNIHHGCLWTLNKPSAAFRVLFCTDHKDRSFQPLFHFSYVFFFLCFFFFFIWDSPAADQ